MNSLLFPLVAAGTTLGLGAKQVRCRAIDRWLFPYRRQVLHRPPRERRVRLLLCIADHYEPRHAAKSTEQARSRVDRWAEEYPRLFEGLRDSDGRPPRHSFF